ncbi:hypothetical protein [Pectobacterium brasiliense]|uniref:hypothetical protein n=1 Tax=Pectobacterium brasiliense TaxID=180957 RepID=UPI0019697774|nr:hypothetical protein [Pectobacterium brasiliense]MBN3262985.1 hypothetical protein [Pectobacterium brasiliense]
MNTQNVNVKTATPEPSERCGLKAVILHVLDRAAFSVCCDEEANIHYGDKFSQIDRVKSWLSGAFTAIQSVIASKIAVTKRFQPQEIVEQARQLCSVIVIESESGNTFQFYGHATLTDEWHPLTEGADIYEEIERVAALNHQTVKVLCMHVIKQTVCEREVSLTGYEKSAAPFVRETPQRITVSESGALVASSDTQRERIQNMPDDVYAEVRSALACDIDFTHKIKLVNSMLRGIENGYYVQVSLNAVDIVRRTVCLSSGLPEDLRVYIQNAINLAPDYHGRDVDTEIIQATIENGDFALAEVIALKMHSARKSRTKIPNVSW